MYENALSKEPAMPDLLIELPRDERAQAIASIERYFNEELDQRIGNIGAGRALR